MERFEFHEINLPRRSRDSHKGNFGRILVIGGSTGMSGAVCLSATAALRGGAGLVTAAVPSSIQSIVASFEPSYMTVGLPCDDSGAINRPDGVLELIDGISAVAIGPGLGQSKEAADLVLSVLKHSTGPVVLDADALNVSAEFKILENVDQLHRCVITPHPGEFSRLTGHATTEINERREELAVAFAAKHGVTVVLKGAGTVVTDGSRVYVNDTGNPGMATGGSGDVLTGLVASQLPERADLFEASVVAVRLHGIAGDLAAAEESERGVIASDLLRFIGAAWRKMQK